MWLKHTSLHKKKNTVIIENTVTSNLSHAAELYYHRMHVCSHLGDVLQIFQRSELTQGWPQQITGRLDVLEQIPLVLFLGVFNLCLSLNKLPRADPGRQTLVKTHRDVEHVASQSYSLNQWIIKACSLMRALSHTWDITSSLFIYNTIIS